jgi:hypothetical protein
MGDLKRTETQGDEPCTTEFGGERQDPRQINEDSIRGEITQIDAKAGGSRFGRSIDKVFNHSWRPEPAERWIWVSKPMVQGVAEYPASLDEIKRFGWKARKLVRVRPPPPLTDTFAERVRSGDMSRGEDERGGPKRRFIEDHQGGRGFADSSGWRCQEDEFHQEQ